MKKYLITGANGLLGQNILSQLNNRKDIQVFATGRGEARYGDLKNVIYSSVDLTNSSQVDELIHQIQPDVCIHTAAMTNVDECENNKEACWDANVNAVAYLLNSCSQFGTHFINVSTDFVFDGEKGNYVETDEPNPVSYYGESKLAAEKLVEAYAYKWSNLRTIIVYGVVHNMSRSNLVLWAKNNLEEGNTINVINDQFRAPTWAGDLAWACIRVADIGAVGHFHISSQEIKSILELVYEVCDHFNLDKSLVNPVTSEELNQPAKRPLKTGFNIEKAKNELGYQPLTFTQGIEKMMNLLR